MRRAAGAEVKKANAQSHLSLFSQMSKIATEHVLEQLEAMRRDHFEARPWHLALAGVLLIAGALGMGFGLRSHTLWFALIAGLAGGAGCSLATVVAVTMTAVVTTVRRVPSGYDGFLAGPERQEADSFRPWVPKREAYKAFVFFYAIAGGAACLFVVLSHLGILKK